MGVIVTEGMRGAEVKQVDRAEEGEVNPVDRLDVPKHMAKSRTKLEIAKERVGACVRAGVGDRQLKEFGDKGLMSNVCSGEKVPEYLARIHDDPAARRRFGRAWLEGVATVKTTTSIEWDEEEKVS